MLKGSRFEIEIPKKFRSMLRCLFLRNPLYETGQKREALLAPWRRIAIFLDPPASVEEATPFTELDPFPSLFRTLDVPVSESIDELALALADRLSVINRNMTGRKVRQTMFMVNDLHCDAMQINLGAPNVEKYQGHPVVEAYGKNGNIVRVAVIEPNRLHRKGQARLENWDEDPAIHPLAMATALSIYGRRSNIRFDQIETGPWGVRAGILGWNTRAMNLGSLLAEIFADIPELFEEPRTGVFTDRYGRVCTYYGWVLSSDEMAAPDIMCRMLELIGVEGHQRHHILRANKDVVQFLDETGLLYKKSQESTLAALFFGYLYLTPEEFREVTECLQGHIAGNAVTLMFEKFKNAGVKELATDVLTRLGLPQYTDIG